MYTHKFFDDIKQFRSEHFLRVISVVEAFLATEVKLYRESVDIYMALSHLRSAMTGEAIRVIDNYLTQVKFCTDSIFKHNREAVRTYNLARDRSKVQHIIYANVTIPTIDEEGITHPATTSPSALSSEEAITTFFTQMRDRLSVNSNASQLDISRAASMLTTTAQIDEATAEAEVKEASTLPSAPSCDASQDNNDQQQEQQPTPAQQAIAAIRSRRKKKSQL